MKSKYLALLLLFSCSAFAQVNTALTPAPKFQFISGNGLPLAGGCLFSFVTGTSTPLATYTDATGTVTNANPVILDANGTASVWLGPQKYRLQLFTAGGIACSSGAQIWQVDGVSGNNITTSTTLSLTAQTAPSCVATQYILWADSGSNRWRFCNNGVLDTIVGQTTTDTLTNKTLTSPTITNGTFNAGTFTGNDTFSGNTTFSGTGTFGGAVTLNGNGAAGNAAIKYPTTDQVIYVSGTGSDANDGLSAGTAKATIAGCLALASSGTGKWACRLAPNYTASFTSTIVLGNAAGTFSVALEGEGATLTCSGINSSAIDGIQIGAGSGIYGLGYGVSSMKIAQGNCNLRSLVTNLVPASGNGDRFFIQGVEIDGNPAQTLGTTTCQTIVCGLVEIENMLNGGTINTVLIFNSPAIGLHVQGYCGSTQCGTGPFFAYNLWVLGNANTNGIPLEVDGLPSALVYNFFCSSCTFNNPGATKSNMVINGHAAGSGQSGITSISFENTHMELATGTRAAVSITDARNIRFQGTTDILFFGTLNSDTGINLSESFAGDTQNLRVDNAVIYDFSNGQAVSKSINVNLSNYSFSINDIFVDGFDFGGFFAGSAFRMAAEPYNCLEGTFSGSSAAAGWDVLKCDSNLHTFTVNPNNIGFGVLHSTVASTGGVTIGSGTSISATSLCSTTACPSGRYRVDVYVDVTTACTTTGSYIVWLGYTDDQGAKTGSSTTTYFSAAGGLGVTPATASTGATLALASTANFLTGTYVLTTTGAATGGLGSINYGTTATACGTGGPMVGKLYLDVTRLE